MPTVHVLLTCATPTNRLGGQFGTFIALSEAAYERGEHIETAKWRAGVIGFRGPYLVTDVRRFDIAPPSIDEIRGRSAELAMSQLDRLMSILDESENLPPEPWSLPAGPQMAKPRRSPREQPGSTP